MKTTIVSALVLTLFGWIASWVLLPSTTGLAKSFPESTSFMRKRLADARLRDEDLHIVYHPVPLDSISRRFRSAVLEREDGRFYKHHGIDWLALSQECHYEGDKEFSWRDFADLTALWNAVQFCWARKEKVSGRSTTTQQLVKNLYFNDERSVPRKVLEVFLTWYLERNLEKDRIFELYLNTAEYGRGIFGIEAAAQHYYGRPASNLTRHQAVALAVTLTSPLRTNPHRVNTNFVWRRNNLCERLGWLKPKQPSQSRRQLC